MPIALDNEQAQARSRVAAHRIISMLLRVFSSWRDVTGGHDETLVLMAVIAITGDRLMGQGAPSEFSDMANVVPQELLGRCNISSIAAATGLNRETARRVVNRLIERGSLQRTNGRDIQFSPGRIQGPNGKLLSKKQMEDFVRTANALIRDGVLVVRE